MLIIDGRRMLTDAQALGLPVSPHGKPPTASHIQTVGRQLPPAGRTLVSRGNNRGNIQIVRCVRIVRAPGRYGRSGAIWTDMTPELPG